MSLRVLDTLEDQTVQAIPLACREITDPSGHIDRCRSACPQTDRDRPALYKDELEVIGNTEAQPIDGQVDQTNGDERDGRAIRRGSSTW